jgi:hypothetical protein
MCHELETSGFSKQRIVDENRRSCQAGYSSMMAELLVASPYVRLIFRVWMKPLGK